MRNKIGTLFMIIGALLVFSALGLLLYNQQEAAKAQKAATELLPKIMSEIEVKKQEKSESGTGQVIVEQPDLPEVWQEFQEQEPVEMPEMEIDGDKYIGYLSIPALQLDLPVMSDWSYPKLKKAPCRYTGNRNEDNLVIMAHNYAYHFGGLKDVNAGDTVFFTDMDGSIVIYEVIARDILNPTAIEEVTGGDYDLTLFTCTYGGKSRVTVYCNRMEGN